MQENMASRKTYRLTARAEDDADGILQYGIETFGYEAAIAYYDGLFPLFERLVSEPLLYPPVDEIALGHRRAVYRSHSIYYRVADTEIVIIRILGRQDHGKQLS